VTEGAVITFYDTDSTGRELQSITVDLIEGINTIIVDSDFDVDVLFIGYDPEVLTLHTTKNRHFANQHYYEYSEISCTFPCYSNSRGSFTQINGGGINVIYNATCSISKLVEDNINIFKEAFWYRIGLELIRERIFSDRFTRWTTLTPEDAAGKESAYAKEIGRAHV